MGAINQLIYNWCIFVWGSVPRRSKKGPIHRYHSHIAGQNCGTLLKIAGKWQRYDTYDRFNSSPYFNRNMLNFQPRYSPRWEDLPALLGGPRPQWWRGQGCPARWVLEGHIRAYHTCDVSDVWPSVDMFLGRWWLEPWNFMTFHILGMSYSQLTNSLHHFSEGWRKTTNQFLVFMVNMGIQYIIGFYRTLCLDKAASGDSLLSL